VTSDVYDSEMIASRCTPKCWATARRIELNVASLRDGGLELCYYEKASKAGKTVDLESNGGAQAQPAKSCPVQGHIDAVFRYTHDAISVAKDGYHVLVNPAYVRLYGGSTAEDFIGRSTLETVVPSDHDRILEYIRLRKAGLPAPTVYETRGIRRDGIEFDVEYRISTYTQDGDLYTVISASDITERKRPREAERKISNMLQALVQASPLPILAIDVEGLVTLWNSAAEKTFGWTAAEVIGKPIPYIPAEKLEEHREMRAFDLKGMGFTGLHVRRRRKDGSPVDLSVSTAPLRDAAGAISGIMTVCMDITEQKRLEDQLRQAQKMEAIGRLAGGVAHDFNNLLTVITGYSQMLAEIMHDPEPQDLAHEILTAAQRAADLTGQLLTFSRRQVIKTEILCLDERVRAMQSFLRRTIGEHIELEMHLGAPSGLVRADPTQIEQVILNLALNARDAMSTGGKLIIETHEIEVRHPELLHQLSVAAGPYILLCVTDTGHGIDPSIRPAIFEPFFTTKEAGRGTGLGLATVYGIVKQHEGGIRLESNVGQGTTFEVYLPAAHGSKRESSSPVTSGLTGGTETILVVEDEIPLRKMVAGMLRSEGYMILEAETPEHAVELCSAHSERIDLLLTDVVMPRIAGPDLAMRLKSLRSDLKVLYMSGYLKDELRIDGSLSPDTFLLQKPFSKHTLTLKIREVLDAQDRDR
jgi:two-component system cell cycle sensor histidine kinase/response regulator CckA